VIVGIALIVVDAKYFFSLKKSSIEI